MDPFTALSLASNIIQFIDFSAKLIDQACAIHSSLTGAAAEDEQLKFVISEMQKLSVRLTSSKPSYQQSDDKKAVMRLTTQCGILSDAILQLLERIKARNPKSKRSSAVAALKSAWKDNKKMELKQRLDSCRLQLQVQLTSLMKSETMNRLKELIQTGQLNSNDLSSLRTNVELLKQGVKVTHINPEAIDQLRSLLTLSDQALQAVARHRILEGLRFDLMNNRFNDVVEAHAKTFQWILDESCKIPSSISQGKSQLSFREWLIRGSDVFHIQGKPGSGKSTLMKFLYRQEKTQKFLQKWAEPKKLVLSKFFFWKPGTARQKSLNGLLRTLLYDVVSQCPEIIPSVFRTQYGEIQQLSSNVHLSLHFEDDEIDSAFERVLEISNESKRFCFFIDGLDEFEGDYKKLISKLKSWTARCKDVKICVSSREWNIFEVSFCPEQRLKLQELTEDDIRATVYDLLANNEQFKEIQADPKKRQRFLEDIVEMAEGVFLWVSLILVSIENGLLSKCRFHDLQRRVKTAPLELEKLFRHLFDTIDPADLTQSFLTFTLVQMFRAQKDDFSLFRYSWLNEYDENKDFAMELSIRNPAMSEQEVLKRLGDAKMRLNAHCRGLVEAQPYRFQYGRQLLGKNLNHKLVLAHRSIADFLQGEDIQRRMESRLKDFDVLDVALQSFLAQGISANLTSEKNVSEYGDVYGALSHELAQVLSSIRNSQHENPRIFRYLDCLDSALHQQSKRVVSGFPEPSQVGAFKSTGNTDRTISGSTVWRLPYYAAELGLFKYVSWKIFSHNGHTGDDLNLDQLLGGLLVGQARWGSQEAIRSVENILRRGADLNYLSVRSLRSGQSSWHRFLSIVASSVATRKICRSDSAVLYICQTIELCLQFKADPRFCAAITHFMSTGFQIRGKGGGTTTYFRPETEFVKYALERGGKVYLQDLVVFLQPENLQSILHLIGRNLRLYGEPSAIELEAEEKSSPEMILASEKTESHNSQSDKEPKGEGRFGPAARRLVINYDSIGSAVPFLFGISLTLVLLSLWRYISAMFTSIEFSRER